MQAAAGHQVTTNITCTLELVNQFVGRTFHQMAVHLSSAMQVEKETLRLTLQYVDVLYLRQRKRRRRQEMPTCRMRPMSKI